MMVQQDGEVTYPAEDNVQRTGRQKVSISFLNYISSLSIVECKS